MTYHDERNKVIGKLDEAKVAVLNFYCMYAPDEDKAALESIMAIMDKTTSEFKQVTEPFK